MTRVGQKRDTDLLNGAIGELLLALVSGAQVVLDIASVIVLGLIIVDGLDTLEFSHDDLHRFADHISKDI